MSKTPIRNIDKEYSEIELKKEPPIAWIILNRPERLNAISPLMISEIEDALKKLLEIEEVKVIIFTGSGDKSFSTGADVNFLKATQISNMTRHAFTRGLSRLADYIEEYPKPTIAAIFGYALGGGLELALACDFRLAADNAIIGLPEVKLGILPAGGGIQRLIKCVGVSRAKEIVMLGEFIGCNEALSLGIINKVFPQKNFFEEVRKFALRLTEIPSATLNIIKCAIRAESEASRAAGQLFEAFLLDLLISTNEARERINAFLKDRKNKK